MVLFCLIPVNWLATVLKWGLITLHSRLEIPSHEVSVIFITVFMYLLGLYDCVILIVFWVSLVSELAEII